MTSIPNVLIEPRVTEKTVAQKGKYSFVVEANASKESIKKAIEAHYGVKVERVNITKSPGKLRIVKRGISVRKKPPLKKATVSLKGGATLDFNAFK